MIPDIDTVKIQMAAYGFFNIYTAAVVNGGLTEFIQLTDFGKRALLELGAVRTGSAGGA